jgi:hypothetical protein
MINVAGLYAMKLNNFGVSSSSQKFHDDFISAFNMVVNDLTTLLDQEIPLATEVDVELDINPQHFNCLSEGLDHFLTSMFEWTHQNKKDSFQFYKDALKQSHTAAMQESVRYGRLGNHRYPQMLYPVGDTNPFWHRHGAVNGPIQPVTFG